VRIPEKEIFGSTDEGLLEKVTRLIGLILIAYAFAVEVTFIRPNLVEAKLIV